ncbi:MAG: carbon-nitrogen hydrolase family protein [Eubacteriales bacterium]|nr:carbon-nitrogen hydrolase family protein [Eubacteriales bacterium]
MRQNVKMTDNKIRVGYAQLCCDGDRNHMLLKAEKMIQQLFKEKSEMDILVFPEQFYQVDCCRFSDEPFGEKEYGNYYKFMSQIAASYNVNVVAGSYGVIVGEGDNCEIRNRSIAFDRHGNEIGYYDKIHLFDAFGCRESDTFSPGSALGIFKLDCGCIGVMICYDLRFPEESRAIRLKADMDLLCVPAAFYKPNSYHWDILTKAAAIYNVTPLVAVNQCGDLPNNKGFVGNSRVLDAKGNVLSTLMEDEGTGYSEIDMNHTRSARSENPEINNRRVDLYSHWMK